MTEDHSQIDYRALLDGLGPGVLLFDTAGRLILDNWSARNILGRRLTPVREEGWEGLARLVDDVPGGGQPSLDELHEQALRSANPVRFHLILAGAVIPCWVAAIYSSTGAVLTLITLERPDWNALTELMAVFRNETQMSLSATRGHAELVRQILRKNEDDPAVQSVIGRVLGFTELIATHMLRLQHLTNQLHRLEIIRTGTLRKAVREKRRRIWLVDFFEDFLEEFADESIADPDMGGIDFRERLAVDIPEELFVIASPEHLANALRDTLRNAACYSPPDTPIELHAYPDHTGQAVQIDIMDHGYGIRDSEHARIFAPFQRAHQPQIIGVDGYGLSLYLTRTELEAMGGLIWYTSTEGLGSTFSLRIPYRSLTETHH